MNSSASQLLDPLLGSPEVDAIFSDHGSLQGMLDFEAALATSEARVGVILASAAPEISAKCRAELFDPSAVAETTALAGNPAIPLVRHLTALVAVDTPEAARFVQLTLPDIPWHTQRDRLAELAMTCGMIVGTLGKISRDVSLLMQTDVGEAFEPAGEGRLIDHAAQAEPGHQCRGAGRCNARPRPGRHLAGFDGAGA